MWGGGGYFLFYLVNTFCVGGNDYIGGVLSVGGPLYLYIGVVISRSEFSINIEISSTSILIANILAKISLTNDQTDIRVVISDTIPLKMSRILLRNRNISLSSFLNMELNNLLRSRNHIHSLTTILVIFIQHISSYFRKLRTKIIHLHPKNTIILQLLILHSTSILQSLILPNRVFIRKSSLKIFQKLNKITRKLKKIIKIY